VSENLPFEVSAHSVNPTGIFVEAGAAFWQLIRVRAGLYGKHMFSVIAVEWPIDRRPANLADFCGHSARPFLFRPLMRSAPGDWQGVGGASPLR
jgi:hypothetical protein